MRPSVIVVVVVIVIVAIASIGTRARAQEAPEQIVLAGSDPTFHRALAEALAPAAMTVISAGDVTPPSLAALSTASRELADRLHATATVWLIPAPKGTTLVTYDRERNRILVRELPYTSPLDRMHAAEMARTVRTMLRALRVTPDVDQPPPRAADAPAIRETIVVRETPFLAASALLGARVGAPDTSISGQLAAIWRPESLGLELAGELAPASDLASSAFHGTVLDGATALLGRAPLRVAPKVRVAALAGAALHLIRLRGRLETGTPIQSNRIDTAARIGVVASYSVARGIDVGVAISADCLLDRQRYRIGLEEILVVPRLQTMVGAIATIRLL
jgi:hypothetical protein